MNKGKHTSIKMFLEAECNRAVESLLCGLEEFGCICN